MEKVSHAAVTLDHSGFAISCQDGFKSYNTYPVTVRMSGNVVPNVGAVRLARSIGATQFVIYVSAVGGKFAQNVAMLFNMEHNRDTTEITTPPQNGPITNIQASHSRIAIFTMHKLFIFQFVPKCQQIRIEEIRMNPTGLSAMSYDPTTKGCYLAYPAFKQGSVQIMDLFNLAARESKSPISIEAHKSEVTQIALNCQGTLLATGSQVGTVIRVFDVRSKARVYELRRGTSPAHLKCLAFSPCSSFLAVASDKGTLHLFGIRDSEPSQNVLERNLGTSSIARIQLSREVLALAFSKQTPKCLRSLIAICSDGSYWQYPFSKDNQGKVHHNKGVYQDLINLYEEFTFTRTLP